MGCPESRPIHTTPCIPPGNNTLIPHHVPRSSGLIGAAGAISAAVAGAGAGITSGAGTIATGGTIAGGACTTICGSILLLVANAAIGAIVGYLVYEALKNAIPVVCSFFQDRYDQWFAIVRYNVNDRLIVQALMDELRAQNPHPINAQIDRDADGLRWIPSDNWYELRNTTGGYLFDLRISENGTKIDIIRKYTTPQELQQDINAIYLRRAAGVENISRYSMGQASWVFSGLSPRQRLNQIVQNAGVIAVMQRVNAFRADPRPHKTLGLFLEGATRSGKSMMSAIIASEFGMPIYSVALDSPWLYDALLEQRIREIPQNSVIVIDEFHQKINALIVRNNALVTLGGILESLDNQHIPNRSILILTAVSAVAVNQIFNGHLLGPGRIDHVVTMNYVHPVPAPAAPAPAP